MNILSAPTDPAILIQANELPDIENIEELKEQISQLPALARFNDEQIEIIYSIAHSLYIQGKLDNAFGIFQILIVYRPFDARYMSAYAICCKRMGKFDMAIPAFAAALAMNSKDLTAAVHMAECLAAIGKKKESAEIIVPLIKLAYLDEGLTSLRKRAETLKDLLENS